MIQKGQQSFTVEKTFERALSIIIANIEDALKNSVVKSKEITGYFYLENKPLIRRSLDILGLHYTVYDNDIKVYWSLASEFKGVLN